MPSPEATQHIQQALSDCLGRDVLVHEIIERLIKKLKDQRFEDFHEVCEPISGFNLGSMAFLGSDGWSGRQHSVFRELVKQGYNPNAADAAGRTPSFLALSNDRLWMNVEDFKWAFANRLDPLAFYPDIANGRSLLSVDFVAGRTGEVLDYLTEVLEDHLLRLDKPAQHQALEMLRQTAEPCYGGLLAHLDLAILDQSTSALPSSSAASPRL